MSRLSARRRGELSRELRHYFLHQPGCGQSNFAPIANLAVTGVRTSGGRPRGDDIAIERLHRIRRAVGRYGEIEAALASLSIEHYEALEYAFGASHLAIEVHHQLGETAGAALLTRAAAEGCRQAAGADREPSREQIGRWLHRACIKGDMEALRPVIEERDELVGEALAAYGEARRSFASERMRRVRRAPKVDEVPFLFPEE